MLKNNKGFSLVESMMMGALGFVIVGAAVSGITWVKNSFSRLSKRSIAVEIVSSFTQNLQEHATRYPNVSIGGTAATYILCFDSSIRPAKNSAGGMDPIVKVLNASAIKNNSGDCKIMGYEVHLTSAADPKQYRLLVIGVDNNLGSIYDETITVFKQ